MALSACAPSPAITGTKPALSTTSAVVSAKRSSSSTMRMVRSSGSRDAIFALRAIAAAPSCSPSDSSTSPSAVAGRFSDAGRPADAGTAACSIAPACVAASDNALDSDRALSAAGNADEWTATSADVSTAGDHTRSIATVKVLPMPGADSTSILPPSRYAS